MSKQTTTIRLTVEQKQAIIQKYGSMANGLKVLISLVDKNLLTFEEQAIVKALRKN